MATLTTSWASYASTSVTISGVTVTFYLEAKYKSQNTTNNTTVVNTRLRSTSSGGTLRGAGYKFTCSYCTAREGTEVWAFANEVILSSDDKTITHNNDGTKSLSLSATAKNTYWGINKSLSATVSLPTINRKATITSAPDFTDEQNPTIKYTNPAGNSVSSLQAGIFSTDGMTTYAGYRDVPKTGSSYTFNLSQQEKQNLQYASRNTSGKFKLRFYIKTVFGSSEPLRHPVEKYLTIVNANPTETSAFLETNQTVIDLLGDNSADTIIQNVSDVQITATVEGNKEATIANVKFENGTRASTIYATPYQTTIIPTTDTFSVTTTDSRGNYTPHTYTKTMIEYVPINITTVTFKRYNPTSSNIILNAEIRYKQTTFGSTPNVPTIKWKINTGNYVTLSSNDYTIDTINNKITINNLTLSNVLPYTDEGDFYLYVEDLLSSDSETAIHVTQGIPTFEAGEHDFQVNGDLYVANTDRTNPINVKDALIDYIVSQGTTTSAPIWTWRKWKSGLAECWGRFDCSGLTMNTASAGTYYNDTSGKKTFNYPSGLFTSVASVTGLTCQGSRGSGVFIYSCENTSTSQCKVNFRSHASSSNTVCPVFIHSIGRWD